ncbi:uncharacterized protein LOC133313346 [Gastrolobium bilobum]|uniref:uncharacterized protein LOC133313346 n=1 Tax=Gastrolobium bilobum TaxID=150636 RepID=UPI002AB092B6|nr:uncharacterized protein LOC133313346 [Gastrolobium bilobum]
MELQTLCCALSSQPLEFSNNRIISSQAIGTLTPFRYQRQRFRFGNALKCLKWGIKEPSVLRLNKFQRPRIHASDSNVNGGLEVHTNQSSSVPVTGHNGMEPFGGKSGSVSFYGLTYHSVEEGKLESAPFKEEKSSYFWLLAPAAFVSSLIIPQFFLGNVVEAFFNDVILADIVSSLSFEALFYIGVAIFLHVADHVQRPYLQYSSKRWGLITGLRGYLYTSFFTMGLKIIAPLLLLYVNWSVVRLTSVVAVAPFLVGCAAQLAFERSLEKRGSSCWPLVPIIFEVYRLYQLTRAARFTQTIMFTMKELPPTPDVAERIGALFAMIVTFQVLGAVCLWSLMTFLLRLFPSRPVADNY